MEVASSDKYIPMVYVNQRGEVYYVAGGLFVPGEIHLVSADLSVDECLYRTGEGLSIWDVDLDASRDILYFSEVSYEEFKSRLLCISGGEVKTLVEEVDGWIGNVVASPAHGVFFTASNEGCTAIYQYT